MRRPKSFHVLLVFVYIFLVAFQKTAFSQKSIKDTIITFPMIGVSAAYQFPGGNLSERFGNDISVGLVFQWKFKNNWLAGFDGTFFFSDNVKEKYFLDQYKTADGNIIDGNGDYSIVSLSERGVKLELKGGKIFPVIGPNRNSGLMTTLGIGYIQHKILIETPQGPIPYIEDEYRKGFDRLTNGFCLTEFMGYIHFGNKRLVNYYAGLEFTQAFTKNKRELNFDSGIKDDKQRTDLFFGIRIGWVFPLYRRNADKIYVN